MAVGKSQQLARSLRSISTRIPYEDVKTAATDIAICLSNVLTVRFALRCFREKYREMGTHTMLQAANGFLQKRTPMLDLDFMRGNALPDDYDTDLESPWSNPSRIVLYDDDDCS